MVHPLELTLNPSLSAPYHVQRLITVLHIPLNPLQANPNPKVGHRLCIAWEGGDPDDPEEDWYEAVISKHLRNTRSRTRRTSLFRPEIFVAFSVTVRGVLQVKDKGNSRHQIKYEADGSEEWVGAAEEFATSSKYNSRRLRWHKDTFSKNNSYSVPTTNERPLTSIQVVNPLKFPPPCKHHTLIITSFLYCSLLAQSKSKALKTPDPKQPRASSPVGWSTKKVAPGSSGEKEEESSEKESSENKVFAFAHQKYAGKVEPKEQDTEVKDQLPEAFNSITDLLSVMEKQEISKVEKTTDTAPEGLAHACDALMPHNGQL
eukprot:9466894-Pyramimonas_sp.AAC.1